MFEIQKTSKIQKTLIFKNQGIGKMRPHFKIHDSNDNNNDNNNENINDDNIDNNDSNNDKKSYVNHRKSLDTYKTI